MFKTRTPREGSLPLGLTLIIAAIFGVLLLSLRCSQTKSWMDRRKESFAAAARLVNGPIRELQPIHPKILPRDQGPIMFLDAQLKACFQAEPLVASLEALPIPLDEMGRTLSGADGVHEAAVGFRAGLQACRAGDAAPEAVSRCLLRCMGDWTSLVRAVDQMRKDADWVGVRVESIAPLVKNQEE